MRLLVHDGVLSEYAESDLETFLRRVVDSVLSRLELTSGSTLKTLRGPYGGTAFRCRAGAESDGARSESDKGSSPRQWRVRVGCPLRVSAVVRANQRMTNR